MRVRVCSTLKGVRTNNPPARRQSRKVSIVEGRWPSRCNPRICPCRVPSLLLIGSIACTRNVALHRVLAERRNLLRTGPPRDNCVSFLFWFPGGQRLSSPQQHRNNTHVTYVVYFYQDRNWVRKTESSIQNKDLDFIPVGYYLGFLQPRIQDFQDLQGLATRDL